MLKVKLTANYRRNLKGDVVELPDRDAKILVAIKKAELIKDKKPQTPKKGKAVPPVTENPETEKEKEEKTDTKPETETETEKKSETEPETEKKSEPEKEEPEKEKEKPEPEKNKLEPAKLGGDTTSSQTYLTRDMTSESK